MQNITSLAALAIRTESIPEDLNGQESQLRKALELVAVAGEILDQVKRKIFYGAKGEYNPTKLNAAAEKLANIDAFDFTADEFINRPKAPVMEGANVRVIHGIIGSITESAELAEAMLTAIDGTPLDMVNVIEESCDILWYLTIMQDSIGISTDDMHKFLIAKLSARYGDKFSDVAAVVRDIGTEREVMERFILSTAE